MVNSCVLFAVRIEFLNIIWTSFDFKELIARFTTYDLDISHVSYDNGSNTPWRKS
jgi:hypothetical protein